MDSELIPDDVWITIFETVDDSAVLATLLQVCHRFYNLATKPLLRELKWIKPDSTERNIESWNGVYNNLRLLARKITIGIPFDFSVATRYPMMSLSPEMNLYDLIHHQLALFPSLTEVVFDGTSVSPYTYRALASIPTLEKLHFNNCTLLGIHTSFQERRDNNHAIHHQQFFSTHEYTPPSAPPPFPVEALAIRHLSLSRTSVPPGLDTGSYHPLCLLKAPNLTSVSLSWTGTIAARYARSRWILPNVEEVDIDMPLLSRDILDTLAAFLDRCPRGPRVQLRIEKHNLSETQMGSVLVPLRGVWNFEGPLGIAACTTSKGLEPTLTHVTMNEPLDLAPLLDGIEKLPRTVEALKLYVRYWDMEVLFAVKHLFKNIRKLEIQYIRGKLSKDFLVVLGADILANMPQLHTLRILTSSPGEDPAASKLMKSIHGGSGGPAYLSHPGIIGGNLNSHNHQGHPLSGSSYFGTSGNGSQPSLQQPAPHSSRQFFGFNSHSSQNLVNTEYDFTYEDEEDLYEQQIVEATLQESLNDAWPNWNGSASRNRTSTSSTNQTVTVPSTSNGLAALNQTTEHFSVLQRNISSISSFTPVPFNLAQSQAQAWQLTKLQWRDYLRRQENYQRESRLFQSSATGLPAQLPPSTTSSSQVHASPPSEHSMRSPASIDSAQSDLRDYLIGWSRYCRSLRNVQIETGWWWERRFEGDRWALRGISSASAATESEDAKPEKSRKGKERETSPRSGFFP